MDRAGQLPDPGTEIAIVLIVNGQLREMGARFEYLWVDDRNVPVALSVSGWSADESGTEKRIATLFNWANVTSMTWSPESDETGSAGDSEPAPEPEPEPVPRAHTHGRVFDRPQIPIANDEDVEVAAEALRELIGSVAARVVSGAGDAALKSALSEFKKQVKRAGQVGSE